MHSFAQDLTEGLSRFLTSGGEAVATIALLRLMARLNQYQPIPPAYLIASLHVIVKFHPRKDN